jgi:hypothetical protein
MFQCRCSWYVMNLRDRVVHMLEEFMLEVGATTKGRDLRLGAVFGREPLETWG